MKKLLFFIMTLIIVATTAFAQDGTPETQRFQNERTVVIVTADSSTYAARYMNERLRQNFRLPYWDAVEVSTTLTPSQLTEDNLKALAKRHHAQLIVVPVVRTWIWRQYHSWGWFDDDEFYTECVYNLSLYAYNVKEGSLKSYTSRGQEHDEAMVLNNPYEVLGKAMDQIMEKFPYTRIPKDI